jgi:dihydropteroate synthase
MPQRSVWKLAGTELSWTQPLIMGIVNVTPDSFSDGGQFLPLESAVAQAQRLVGEGADILDIGGESSRPGADGVPVEEELRRVIPVIEALAQSVTVPLSIDTTKAAVARSALTAGAHIVNDISGLQFDSGMIAVCKEFRAGVVCNHIQGTPQTMQLQPTYTDVVAEVADYFRRRLEEFTRSGLEPEQIVFDPGIGFGKTADHNLQLLGHISALQSTGRPLLIGHSRKRFLQKLLGRPVDERLFGTVGVSIAVAQLGAEIIRVHDVRATKDAWQAYQAVMTAGQTADAASA